MSPGRPRLAGRRSDIWLPRCCSGGRSLARIGRGHTPVAGTTAPDARRFRCSHAPRQPRPPPPATSLLVSDINADLGPDQSGLPALPSLGALRRPAPFSYVREPRRQARAKRELQIRASPEPLRTSCTLVWRSRWGHAILSVAAVDVRRWRQPLRSRATEGESVERRRKVHKGTHEPASVCLPTPLPASRCLRGFLPEIDALHPHSRSYRAESAFSAQRPAPHGHLLRNEGAVGSNPITSTTKRLVAHATRRFC
jgi:hypothetical protein